jgi:hypothetical protein
MKAIWKMVHDDIALMYGSMLVDEARMFVRDDQPVNNGGHSSSSDLDE